MNKSIANLITLFVPGSRRRKMVRLCLTASQLVSGHIFRSYKEYEITEESINNEFSAAAGQYEFNPPGKININPAWKIALHTPPQRILEIGSWQGLSAVVWNYLYPQAKITCVDMWAEFDQMDVTLQPEKYFDANTANFTDRLRKIKCDSALAMAQLHADGEQFDCIFIDGSHFEDDVMVDTLLAWRLLTVGGYLVWDDYNWKRSSTGRTEYGDKVPKQAINHFLKRHNGEYVVRNAFPQIIIEKTKIFRDGEKFIAR